MSADLRAELEYYARQVIRPGCIEALACMGVALHDITATRINHRWPTWFVGLANIEKLSGDLWAPCEGGMGAFVLPSLNHGEVVDLVAFSTAAHRHPLRRRGDAWCLGFDCFDLALWEHHTRLPGSPPCRPLVVHDSVVTWLRSGGTGIVPLDWRRTVTHLRELPVIVAASRLVGARLEFLLRQRAPKIVQPARATIVGEVRDAA